MKFKVKYDLPMILTMIVIIAVLLTPVIIYFPTAISLLFLVFTAIVIVGCATFAYKLTNDKLVIMFGVFRWSFKLRTIKALEPMKKPAMFKLSYGKKSYTYLSVCDPDAFAAALQARIGK